MSTERFGQLVIGPPGAGKSTYCTGMYDLLTSLGRDVRVINLDPACSPQLPYPCAVDIRSLITLEDAMDSYGLGPNGGIIYAMEYAATNLDWLQRQLEALPASAYLLFDFPGQVELYTCSTALDALFRYLQSASQHLTAVHLVDSHHLHSPSTFLSAVLLSLSSMCRLSLPHVNVLSKADAIDRMGDLPMPLSAYTDGLELSYIMQHIRHETQQHTSSGHRRDERADEERQGRQTSQKDGKADGAASATSAGVGEEEEEEECVEFDDGAMSSDEEGAGEEEEGALSAEPRYLRLSALLCELVDSYSLVSFSTLAIADKRSALQLLRTIDISNGYAFTNTDREYEMALARQQQQARSEEAGAQQPGDTGRQRPAGAGAYSMFNLVNTHDDSTQHAHTPKLAIHERDDSVTGAPDRQQQQR